MFHKILSFICLIIFLVLFPKVNAQLADTARFSPEQLKEDTEFFFQTLYQTHPNIYANSSIDEFEQTKVRIYQQLTRKMTAQDFAFTLGVVNSLLDNHSQVMTLLDTIKGKYFPPVRIRNEKVYFTHKNKEVELLTINGIDMKDVLTSIQPFRSKEYEKTYWNNMESGFPDYLHLLFGITSPFRVTFKTHHRTRTETVEGEILGPLGESVSYKLFSSSSIALLTIRSFRIKMLETNLFKENFQSLLDSIQKHHIQNLFIDLTENGGGSPPAMKLTLDILKHDTIFFSYNRLAKVSAENKDEDVKQKGIGYHLYQPAPKSIFSEPTTTGFSGRVFILQGTITNSGADFFCRMVTENNLGCLVGEATGGLTKTYTTPSNFRTPNTNIPFTCSKEYWDFSSSTSTKTLAPDITWDINYPSAFTERELKNMIEKYLSTQSK